MQSLLGQHWIFKLRPSFSLSKMNTISCGNNNCYVIHDRKLSLADQAPVVWRSDNAIHWINLYPVDNAIHFVINYPLQLYSDLSVGLRYLPFMQLGPEVYLNTFSLYDKRRYIRMKQHLQKLKCITSFAWVKFR